MSQQRTPSSLPRTNYVMEEKFPRHILAQLGIVMGHQGYDNNILLAEAFMKLLPQVLLAIEYGELNNTITGQPPVTKIDPLFVERVNQIWVRGLYCVIFRDKRNTERVLGRAVAYPSRNKKIMLGNKELKNPWDISMNCPECEADSSNIVGFMEHNYFEEPETTALVYCLKCRFRQEYEVEVKPPFERMPPIRPRAFNPIWVETSVDVPIKYALEGVDLMALASMEGGFGYKVGNEIIPMYETYEDILNSPDSTSFVSKKYYDDTIGLEYREWRFYYNPILVKMHQLATEEKMLMFGSTKRTATPRID